jgi:diguanylate cyclase (GGDEF)-like protein/PAS domain S-box-containing protein
MLTDDREPDERHAALTTLLEQQPDAIIAALDDSGFRIPVPDSVGLDLYQRLDVADERTTMLDLVVPADRIAVVSAWERAQDRGVGFTTVHLLSDKEPSLTLTFFDARPIHGVWLAQLTRDGERSQSESQGLTLPLVVPARPRQATVHKNMYAVVTRIDDNATKMLGWTAEQLIGSRSSEFIHPEDQERAVSAFMQLLATKVTQRVRVRHRCADGGWLWIEIENVHNGADDADDVEITTQISDISDEMTAHEALRRREQLFSRLAEALPSGVLQLGADGSVVYANARLSTILGTATPATATDLLATVVPADRAAVTAAVASALHHGVDSELELALVVPRGTQARRCALTVAAVDDQEGRPGVLICVSDVTESAKLREELKIQATHDALTGCLNRCAVIEALEALLSEPGRAGTALIFIDIDNFKPVNDRLGHAAGDELLMHVAGRLRRLCREDDLVARLGGDEFLLVCRGAELPSQAAAVATRVRDALSHPIALPTTSVEISASIGVAWPEGEMAAERLIRQADAAMYESKRRRDGEPVLFADIASRYESKPA